MAREARPREAQVGGLGGLLPLLVAHLLRVLDVGGAEPMQVLARSVVNCGGLWAKQVGLMAGLDLPVTPMEHHYLVTETIPEIAAGATTRSAVVIRRAPRP